MFTRASFTNFKVLRQVAVDFRPLTVLVGPNGAGKSSVLQGLRLVARLAERDPDLVKQIRRAFGPPERLLALRTQAAAQLALTVEFSGVTVGAGALASEQGGQTVYDFDFFITKNGRKRIARYSGWADNSNQAVPLHEFFGELSATRMAQTVYLQLDPTFLCAASASQDELPRLAENGAGLASTLSYLAGAEPEAKAQIEADLREIVPQAKTVRVKPTKLSQGAPNPAWGHRFELELQNGNVVPAEHLSEGTLIVLGLLTALHGPGKPKVILLDDIDRGLHLEAQTRLVDAIRKLQTQDPERQIICTSHSPYLLDAFAPEEVRVLALDDHGYAACAPLTAHPEYERWRRGLRAGELWATLGEKWVTGAADDRI